MSCGGAVCFFGRDVTKERGWSAGLVFFRGLDFMSWSRIWVSTYLPVSMRIDLF